LEKAVKETDVTFICVGTPANLTGEPDLSQVQNVTQQIGKALKNKPKHAFVVKSTVPPGTTESLIPVLEQSSGRKASDFEIFMNPEFLSEGSAISDFMKPDMIVIGSRDRKAGALGKLYAGAGPVFETDLRTAEMVKYALNSFLATKITFINEIGNICKELGLDTYEVAEIFSKDKRVSPHFLRSGIGFGGSCLPKDVSALIHKAKELGLKPSLLEGVMETNRNQPLRLVAQLERKMSVKGKLIGLLGVAFKADTSDTRATPAVPIIKALLEKGAKVCAYDPKANLRDVFPDLPHLQTMAEVLEKSDAILVLTEEKEFVGADEKTDKPVLYGRRLKKAKPGGGVCW
jgi:UDPglucose 6-dehydrogenase